MTRVPRPTKPALNREYILDQALDLIDRQGLDSFSMRRLGAQVGVDPMAFYHYFPHKAALFDGLAETVYREAAAEDRQPGANPREKVLEAVRALRKAFLRHPRVLPILATRPANTPAVLELVEEFLGILTEAGLPSSQILDAVTCLTVYTIGHALAQAGEPQGGHQPDFPGPAAGLSRLAEALAAALPFDPDRQFELGLHALVTGLLPSV